jgi:hypothetical protein
MTTYPQRECSRGAARLRSSGRFRLDGLHAATSRLTRANGAAIEADYSVPSAGPPLWDLWATRPTAVVGAGPAGAMRWRWGRG